MRIAYLVPIILLASATFAQAPTTAPGLRNASAVTGGTYTVDPGHTIIIWTLDHLGITPYSGIFGDVTGTLSLDPKNLNAAKVDVTIPVSKVVTASAGLTKHLLSPGKDGGKPDFFGAVPSNARFVSTKIVANGHEATITGDLTLNDVTKPVTLDATFYGAGKAPAQLGGKENVGFKATAMIIRSEFGLGFGTPMVGDEVTLEISAAFQK